MFTYLVFQTKEIGKIVISRLTKERGGLGDITATREGVVVSGHFDLRTPEALKSFQEALERAEALVPTLKEKAAGIPEWKIAQVEEEHVHSTMSEAISQEIPVQVGLRKLILNRDFDTLVDKYDDKGNYSVHCCLCLQKVLQSDHGLEFERNSVQQIGIYNPHGKDDDPQLIIETSTDPKITENSMPKRSGHYLHIHGCVSVVSKKIRTCFRIPQLILRPKSEGKS